MDLIENDAANNSSCGRKYLMESLSNRERNNILYRAVASDGKMDTSTYTEAYGWDLRRTQLRLAQTQLHIYIRDCATTGSGVQTFIMGLRDIQSHWHRVACIGPLKES
jgi:hypothetical protein